MADGSIRIKIGAYADRSFDEVFSSLPQKAERAARNTAKALNAGMMTGARSFDQIGRSADKSARDAENAWKRELAGLNKIAREQDRIWERAAKNRVRTEQQAAKEIERTQREQTRETARSLEQQIAMQERAMRRVEAAHQRTASRVSHRAVRFLFPNPIGAFGMASRIGGDILRGAGVDFSVAGSVSRAVGVQSLATQLSNQGYMPQEHGANASRVASSTLEMEARSVAKAQAFDPEQVLRAQTKFVDLTGNLDDARKALPQIMALSGATATDPEKMAEAWANVSRHMGDIPDKAKKVEGLMRMIAGQGKIGSIEIKDEAKDLAKIAAAADRYAGRDKAENIGKLTTLAQLARAEGGAASSAQAATSVARFTDLFSTPARVKAMMKSGLKTEDLYEVNAKGARTGIKDPFEIIKKALTATGGDLVKMNKLFSSVMAARSVNALTTAYTGAGGGQAGLAAVDKVFAEFGKEATLSQDQVSENNAKRMATDEAKAKEFQNALDEVIATTKGELTPALTALAPMALKGAQGLSQIVVWAAQHPIGAIGVAVGGAIARSGVEAGFRAITEKLVMATMAAGPLGIAFGLLAAAAGAAAAAIESDVAKREEEQRKGALENAEAGTTEARVRRDVQNGTVTNKDVEDTENIGKQLIRRIRAAEAISAEDKQHGGAPTGAALALENFVHPERNAARQDAQHIGELKNELVRMSHLIDMMHKGTQNVRIVNPGDIKTGGASGQALQVNDNGRGKNPSH